MTSEKYSVLLIEDNVMFQNIAEEILTGHDVTLAATVKDGIDKFHQVNPQITLVDIKLPDGDGHEIVSAIKNENPAAFVVMVTASRLEEDIKKAVDEGADGYVMKPFSSKRLKECIEQYNAHIAKLQNS